MMVTSDSWRRRTSKARFSAFTSCLIHTLITHGPDFGDNLGLERPGPSKAL